MTIYASAKKGDMKVQPLDGQKLWRVAASQSFVKGDLVYMNGANGATIVPTSGAPGTNAGYKCFVATDDANNAAGALGDKSVHVVGKGAVIVMTAEGAITLNTWVRAGTSTAGRVKQWTVDTTSATTVADGENAKVGLYIGHPGEGTSLNNDPTDAADGDLILVRLGA